MGKILEILLGKTVSVSGDLLHGLDDQDFQVTIEERIEVVKKVLRKAGFSTTGKEVYIDGCTGEQIQTAIMTGVVSYVKLNHMVARKVHARSTGPVHMLTRQPTEGRQQGGGLRFGPMEAECVLAHNAVEVLRERMLTTSDLFPCFACKQCGFIADGNRDIQYYFCRTCMTSAYVCSIDLGYSTKLMIQELQATGIKVSLELDDS